ncbi:MAG: VCBS repeat-containing protein, partial [Thermoanaerobaculia bacterium]|nr:VCBS repeat-containing protein [Thermoanaerobaculia bacterium]
MSPRIHRIALQVALLLTAGAATLGAQVSFTDVTADHGLDEFVYNGVGGHALGACWIDFDNDDWPDLFITNGFNKSPHLYRNDLGGSGTFINADDLLPAFPNVEMMSCAFADYDNDGDDDIYIFTDNELELLHNEDNPPDGPPNILLKNMWAENGGELPIGGILFEDVTASAGLLDLPESPFGDYPGYRSTTGGWLDYDRDGFTDLYVAHWQTAHGGEETNKDSLYRNNGDGTFTDVSVESGIQPGTDPTTYRPGLAFIAAHLDNDHWPDLYVINVHDESPY